MLCCTQAIIVEAVEATQGGGPADRDSSPLYQMSRAGLDKDIRREFRMQKLGTSPQVEFERYMAGTIKMKTCMRDVWEHAL